MPIDNLLNMLAEAGRSILIPASVALGVWIAAMINAWQKRREAAMRLLTMRKNAEDAVKAVEQVCSKGDASGNLSLASSEGGKLLLTNAEKAKLALMWAAQLNDTAGISTPVTSQISTASIQAMLNGASTAPAVGVQTILNEAFLHSTKPLPTPETPKAEG